MLYYRCDDQGGPQPSPPQNPPNYKEGDRPPEPKAEPETDQPISQ
jgi:hypothetical protein